MLTLLLATTVMAQSWQAGAAKVDITPEGPIWMAGYAARTKPSEGVLMPLHAKALAIDDGHKGRIVFVGADIIGFPKSVAEEIAIAALKEYKLERSQLVLNASHTHSGPVVWPNLSPMYFFSAAERAKVDAFTRKLVGQTVDLIGTAIGNLKPAQVEYDLGQSNFASYRRNPERKGPTDHAVPTLRVRDAKGQLTAVLFGYSCHNTTLTGEFYQLSGDYAGFAQAEVEAKFPGSVALFTSGCGGDQNPYPRSALVHAKTHGHELAESVIASAGRKGEVLKGRIRSRYQMIDLPFQPFGRNDFEEDLKSANRYVVSRAKVILTAMDNRSISRELAYPIQAIKLGQASVVTMGGEVVVDYCLRLRRETGNDKLFVMGYSNDVMCYIPTKKIVEEGGYEAKDSFMYYGMPAPLKGEIEEIIIDKVKALLKKVTQ